MVAMIAIPLQSSVAAAAPRTIPIGVDHSTPAGHNFEYVDYFPRSGVTVHAGDVLDFAWSTDPDGLHTATLLKTGETPSQAWTNEPLATLDSDDGPGQLQINPAIGAPTNPTCGGAVNPCPFDGTSDLNSGAIPTDTNGHFLVRIAAPTGTYNYVCLIHPGMTASFTVVGPTVRSSTPASVKRDAGTQGRADTNGALAAEAAVPPAQVQHNPGGGATVTITAGTATPFVEVAEMLPRNTVIHPGDTVHWITQTIKDPHTVTFPRGSDPSTEPLPNYCEGNPDVLQTGPPASPPCGDPTKFETHLNVAPTGGTVISSPHTVATSGVIGNPPAPFPTNYSFSFPNAGTYTYQCRIHDHMLGTIKVRPAT